MRKARKPRRQLYPLNQERQLKRVIENMIQTMYIDTRSILFPVLPAITSEAKLDDYSDKITQILGQINLLGNQVLQKVKYDVEKIGNDTETFNRKEFNKVITSVIGVNIFEAEPSLRNELNNFSQEATSYITKLSNETLTEIGRLTRNGVEQGLRASEIEKQIRDRFGISKNRAKLIARDQMGKLNGAMTKKRQTSLGIKDYTWRTSQDERVVGTPGGLYPHGNAVHGNHYQREGKQYSWNEPPHDGNPGFPIQCRCYGEPILPDDLLNKYGVAK